MAWIFWICALAVIYVYLGYPLVVGLLGRLRPLQVKRGASGESWSVIVVGYNEAETLPAKLSSILAAAEAGTLAEILVVSDGSTDHTAGVLAEMKDPRIRHVPFAVRRGKPSVLNEVIPRAEGGIVILTDARQVLHPDALVRLTAPFHDEQVGAVSGELVFRRASRTTSVAEGLNVYWEYEKFIRNNEGRWGSVPGATGALYALRRNLYQPIHPDMILDDIAIPMRIVLQGYRCIFEAGAIAYDAPSATAGKESVRKRRTIAGNLQILAKHPELLLPGRNPIWFQYFSHKIMRLFSPFFLVGALGANILLLPNRFYLACLVIQIVFYLMAAGGKILQAAGVRTRWLGAPLMFVALNLTTLQAWGDALTGRFRVTWDRSDKPGEG